MSDLHCSCCSHHGWETIKVVVVVEVVSMKRRCVAAQHLVYPFVVKWNDTLSGVEECELYYHFDSFSLFLSSSSAGSNFSLILLVPIWYHKRSFVCWTFGLRWMDTTYPIEFSFMNMTYLVSKNLWILLDLGWYVSYDKLHRIQLLHIQMSHRQKANFMLVSILK